MSYHTTAPIIYPRLPIPRAAECLETRPRTTSIGPSISSLPISLHSTAALLLKPVPVPHPWHCNNSNRPQPTGHCPLFGAVHHGLCLTNGCFSSTLAPIQPARCLFSLAALDSNTTLQSIASPTIGKYLVLYVLPPLTLRSSRDPPSIRSDSVSPNSSSRRKGSRAGPTRISRDSITARWQHRRQPGPRRATSCWSFVSAHTYHIARFHPAEMSCGFRLGGA